MPTTCRVMVLLLACSPRAPALEAQAPTFQEISGYIEGGLEVLRGGDTAGYRAGRRRISGRIERAKRPISNSSPAFELPERDLTAEGTAWDTKTRTLFLSSFYKRKIVAIGSEGSARDFIADGQDGIGPVAGLEVDPVRRGLWAASMVLPEAGIPLADSSFAAHGLLFHYDVDTGRLRRRYVLPPAGGVRHGFNDLTVLSNGDVYLTDSPSGAVYLVPAGGNGFIEVIPPSTYTFPNGITRSDDGRRLFVAHGGGIDRIEVATRRRIRLQVPDSLNLSGIDGLAFYRNGLIAHQPSWFQRVVRLRLDPKQEEVASWETIERHHPRFVQPTTGEVAGDDYYYIANAQLRRFREGKIFPWDSLDPVLVLKASLRWPDSLAIARARRALGDAVRDGAAPGAAVAVAAGGKVVWSEAFGVADLRSGARVTPATRFGVGSISKTYTLAAALTLADESKLDLDAPVERYLPDFPHRGRGVTVRRIAAHQSGIADAFADRYYYTTVHFASLDSAYRGIAAAPLAFTPGSRTEYATGIFTIVGRILERMTGESYLDVMRRRVFAPAGMSATVPNDPRHLASGRAAFYVRRADGGFDPAPVTDPSFKLPGAGFLSTAEDLARFGAALLGPGLLSAGSKRELFTPVPLADGTPTRYALGFQVLEEDGRRVLLQPGGGPGIAGWLAVYPDDDLVVAILANATDAPLGDAVRRTVASAFLRPRAPGP